MCKKSVIIYSILGIIAIAYSAIAQETLMQEDHIREVEAEATNLPDENISVDFGVESIDGALDSDQDTSNNSPGKQVAPSQSKVIVRGWDSEKKEEIIVRPIESVGLKSATDKSLTPDTVSSIEDLEKFAQGALISNENVASIKLTSELTEINYKYKGKMLGIYSVSPIARLNIDEAGRIKAKFPWYEMFVRRITLTSIPETAFAGGLTEDDFQLTKINLQAHWLETLIGYLN